jgi:hypothetical protein
VVAAIVGSAASGCELKPDPDRHAHVAAKGSNPAPDAAPPLDAAPPPDAAAQDAGAPPDAGSDAGPAAAVAPVKPPVDAKLERRVLARCTAQKRWAGHAFFHTQNTPFSVLVGTPNHWKWVSRSSPSESFAQQLEVPLDALVRATGLAGLTPSAQVLVVSGIATDQDLVQETDDDALNRLIYQRQNLETGTLDIVRLAHDNKSEGKPLSFGPQPTCITPPPGSHVTDHCATPQCPK